MPENELTKKERMIAAMELTVDELLIFAEEPMPSRGHDESDTAYINRINKLSSAKKKALYDASDLIAKINLESRVSESEVKVSESAEETNDDDDRIPTPESRAN